MTAVVERTEAPVADKSTDVKRFVRFEDVYLLHFDMHGKPIWVPRDEAQDMGSPERARNAARQARRYEGRDAPIVVVRVTTRIARMQAALAEARNVLSLCTTRRFSAPEDEEVGRLGARLGYGAVMSAASKEWAKLFDGTPQHGSQHTCGPAQATVGRTLAIIDAALREAE